MADELTMDSGALIFATLADVYLSSGMIDEAISILKDGLSRNPTYTLAKIILGRAYYMKSDLQEAIKVLEEAHGEVPNSENANLYLGHSYKKLGEESKAIGFYKNTLQINPDNKEAQQELQSIETTEQVPPSTPPVEAIPPIPPGEEVIPFPETSIREKPGIVEGEELSEEHGTPEVKAEPEPEIGPAPEPEPESEPDEQHVPEEPVSQAGPVQGLSEVQDEAVVESAAANEEMVSEAGPVAQPEETPMASEAEVEEEPLVPETESEPHIEEEGAFHEVEAVQAATIPDAAAEPVSVSQPAPSETVIPFETLKEPVNKLLAMKTVKGAVICSPDGLLIQNYYQDYPDIEELCAMVAAIYNEAREAFRFLEEGIVDKFIIEKGKETVCVISAGESLLVVITKAEAKPGLVFIYARKIIEEIMEILG